jgi:hypothetical protein
MGDTFIVWAASFVSVALTLALVAFRNRRRTLRKWVNSCKCEVCERLAE